jgi:hypothetical protein
VRCPTFDYQFEIKRPIGNQKISPALVDAARKRAKGVAEARMDEARMAHIFGLSLGGLFAAMLLLNALAY